MEYLMSHYAAFSGILLLISELGAAISQLIYPDNKGLNGFFASIIRLQQSAKAKEPGQ